MTEQTHKNKNKAQQVEAAQPQHQQQVSTADVAHLIQRLQAGDPPSDLTPNQIMRLQSTFGNQAVLRMIDAQSRHVPAVPEGQTPPSDLFVIKDGYTASKRRIQRADTSSDDFLGPGWAKAGRLGLVYKDEGVNLRDKPLPGEQSNVVTKLPHNTRVIIVKENSKTGWYAVRVQGGKLSGKFGYAAQSHVRDDLPDPKAVMYTVKSGDMLGKLVQNHPQYDGYPIQTGDDARSLATAVYVANKELGGVRLNETRFKNQSSMWDYFLDETDRYRAEMRRIYQSVELIEGKRIWLPGTEYVARLKSANIIPSRAGWKNAAIEAGKAIGGFTTGIVEGFLKSIVDALVGLYEIGKSIIDMVIDVVTGEILKKVQEIYDYFAKMSADDLMKLAEKLVMNLVSGVANSVKAFVAKWNQNHVYNKWNFRGNVVGHILSEVVMILVSGGAANALKWLGKLGKVGSKLASIIRKVGTKIDDVMPRRKRRKGDRDRDSDADGPAGERARAIAQAKLITEGHDEANQPIPVLMTALAPLRKYKGVNGFVPERIGPGTYRIVMRTVIDGKYTTGGEKIPRNITEHGLNHSFDRHAHEWFGRAVSRERDMDKWRSLIEYATRNKKPFPWKTGDSQTVAHLVYRGAPDKKWFMVQYFAEGERFGELATAFIPNASQRERALKLMGRF